MLISYLTFLLLFSGSAAAYSVLDAEAKAKQQGLAASAQWLSLLHFSKKTTHISNEDFLLTWPKFSAERELTATLEKLFSAEAQSFGCRFPARVLFLKQFVDLPDINFQQCPELVEFLEKSPVDNISLVYVSENISQPSSMMGHTFLKVSGATPSGREVSHAISFYTKIDTLNVPKLMYQSLVSGKPGYYSLSPYKDKVDEYVRKEQRNLWELSIDLSEFERKLIAYHLYELKNRKYEYFFQDYNCATIVSLILSLSIHELREPEGRWVTPLDVLKIASKSRKIKETKVIASSKWKLRMLEPVVPFSSYGIIMDEDDKYRQEEFSKYSIDDQVIIKALNAAYSDFKYDQGLISAKEWSLNNDKFSSTSNSSIRFSKYRNPTELPQDSQVTFGYAIRQNDSGLLLTYVPASHSIEDDNRQHFGETGLNLGRLQLFVDDHSGKISVDKFDLYRAESILNRGKLSGGVSGRFAVGIDNLVGPDSIYHHVLYVRGAFGVAKTLWNDVDIYALGTLGLGRTNTSGFISLGGEAGAIVREISNMKSLIKISQTYGEFSNNEPRQEMSFTQAKYLNSSNALFLTAQHTNYNGYQSNEYSISIRRYF